MVVFSLLQYRIKNSMVKLSIKEGVSAESVRLASRHVPVHSVYYVHHMLHDIYAGNVTHTQLSKLQWEIVLDAKRLNKMEKQFITRIYKKLKFWS